MLPECVRKRDNAPDTWVFLLDAQVAYNVRYLMHYFDAGLTGQHGSISLHVHTRAP
jgi:hypothetical protein